MADRSVVASNTFEQFRVEFNELATDVGDIASITGASGRIASATDVIEAVTAIIGLPNAVTISGTMTAGNFTTSRNAQIGGNITNGSVNLTFPTVGGTISTEGFSIALATALG